MKHLFSVITLFTILLTYAQENIAIRGTIMHKSTPIENATVEIIGTNYSTQTDSKGIYSFQNIPKGNYKILVTVVGY